MDDQLPIFLASDFHLGLDFPTKSKDRERYIVSWLKQIHQQYPKASLYLVGDVFDFWFEYRRCIPQGYTRFLGQLASMADTGWDIHFFMGNHDMWVGDYFTKEMGWTIHPDTVERTFFGKKYLIGHGDGLGPGDFKYKLVKKFLRSSLCQWLFHRLHPNFGLGLMRFFSHKSRYNSQDPDFLTNIDKEYLVQFVEQHHVQISANYYIFGHRHVAIEYHLKNQAVTYFNLGDWLYDRSYIKIDKDGPHFNFFENPAGYLHVVNK